MSKSKLAILILGVIVLLGGVGVGIYLVTQPTGFFLKAQNKAMPQGVKVVAVTDETATINWTSEEAVQSLVYYGLNSGNLTLVQSEAVPAKDHSVELVGLLPASTYYFTINVGKEQFTSAGAPWQFKTGVKEVVSPTPTPVEVTVEAMKVAMGTSSVVLDLNEDGVVNAVDVRKLMLREATGSASLR